MTDMLTQYDTWLDDNGPAALVIREHLMPIEGTDGVLFPATFAASEDRTFKGGYNIDVADGTGTNVCLVDSVGSQANRIEPLFGRNGYKELIPQIVVKAGDKYINILDAGHRAGDAIVRCSELQQELQQAFKAVQSGNAEPLARVAPTSLIFGVWDSRDTQAKLPRLLSSTIRAYNVRKLTRSAQFVPATEYVESGLLEKSDDKKVKDAYAVRGFIHVPASGSHGGVIADGGVRRDAALHLAALRLLSVGSDTEKTTILRRYILGLALTALTYNAPGYLRQGCNLVLDPDKKREFKIVFSDGSREDCALSHEEALVFAKQTAAAFGLDITRDVTKKQLPDREVPFDRELAKRDISGDSADGKKEVGKSGGKKGK